MTQYTRSAIPGRAPPEDRPADRELDRMVFGRAQSEPTVSEPDAPRRISRRAEPMPDDDAPPEHLFTERAPRERRKATRRKTDYTPLPDDAGSRASESRRGPLILFVTLIVIGVFGAVVWNAYSSGLRAPDGGPTPELASAGPFKSRPAVDESKPADIDASVFERVAVSKKTPELATTSEVRPDPDPAPETAPVARPEPKIEAPKPEPVKIEAPKPAPIKLAPAPAATPVKASTQTAAIAPPKSVAVAAKSAKPAAASAAGGTTDAAVPASATLDGASTFHPAFAATGAYVVQLAAPSTEEAAQAEWGRRAKAAPGLLEAAEKLVIKADVNGKTVYRLRAGSFATSADANAFCSAIKASGGACFTAKK
jgi:hypothetical protein